MQFLCLNKKVLNPFFRLSIQVPRDRAVANRVGEVVMNEITIKLRLERELFEYSYFKITGPNGFEIPEKCDGYQGTTHALPYYARISVTKAEIDRYCLYEKSIYCGLPGCDANGYARGGHLAGMQALDYRFGMRPLSTAFKCPQNFPGSQMANAQTNAILVSSWTDFSPMQYSYGRGTNGVLRIGEVYRLYG